jgi:AcrR family transcriptional regulator
MQDDSTRRSQAERTAAMRARLVAAGRALFVERGYAETGTPEIVAAAGVTRGALYHHFADKAALFRAVVEAEAAAVAAEVERAARGPGALEKGADAWFAAMAEPGRVRLLLRDGPAVLGTAEMLRIDGATGGASLQRGLEAALGPGPEAAALAEVLSAAFDRAALAIAAGAAPRPYRAALARVMAAVARNSGPLSQSL